MNYKMIQSRLFIYHLMILGMVVLCFGIGFDVSSAIAGPRGTAGDLYVSDNGNNRIVQIDGFTGEIMGDFVTTNLSGPEECRFGPNGNLFVVNRSGSVNEYDGNTGAFIGVFAKEFMISPTGMRFTADGHLLVYNDGDGSITEYDDNGVFIGNFATGVSGDLAPLDFGADGNLYVSTFNPGSISRMTPDGMNLGTFASGGGLFGAEGHTFGGINGNLFVCSLNTNTVNEYDRVTGKSLGVFIDTHLNLPTGVVFGPDGNAWVANLGGSSINRFDGVTGAWLGGVTGFDGPVTITVKPGPLICFDMLVSVLTAGKDGSWAIRGAPPGVRVVVVYGFKSGKTVINNQFNFCAVFGIAGISQNSVVGTSVTNGQGNATIVKRIPANTSGMTLFTQAATQGTCPDSCISVIDIQVIQ